MFAYILIFVIQFLASVTSAKKRRVETIDDDDDDDVEMTQPEDVDDINNCDVIAYDQIVSGANH